MTKVSAADVGRIDNDLDAESGVFVVDFDTFAETLAESETLEAIDTGSMTITRALRAGRVHWFIDNPHGGRTIMVETLAA